MALVQKREDTLDKLVVFLAKRDGIDKLVKTFQYIFKLAHWRLLEKHPDLARRAKLFEDSCGLSRKAFRTGRALTGFNNLRRTKFKDLNVSLLTLLGSSGEMVYFFFDHFTWMSRVGLLDSKLAARFAFISAYGEIFLYLAFMTLDGIMIHRDSIVEEKLNERLRSVEENLPPTLNIFRPQLDYVEKADPNPALKKILAPIPREELMAEAERIRKALKEIEVQRVMRSLSIAAQFADLLIALAIVEPRPVWCHPLTLGVSGLVSAWSGWYRLWPN